MPSPSRRPHVVRDDKRQRRDQGQHRILRPRTLRHVLLQVRQIRRLAHRALRQRRVLGGRGAHLRAPGGKHGHRPLRHGP